MGGKVRPHGTGVEPLGGAARIRADEGAAIHMYESPNQRGTRSGRGPCARYTGPLAATLALAAAAAVPLPLGAAPRVIRINCGGGWLEDPCGRTWSMDFGFDGGVAELTQKPIAETGNPLVYQTGRWSDGPLRYTIPVEEPLPEQIAVALHFAEIFPGACAPMHRVFDVWIEGQEVLRDFDLWREAGCFRALSRAFAIQAEGSAVEIEMRPVIGEPKIAGIEIYLDPDHVDRCAPCPADLACTVAPGPSVRLTWRNQSPDYPTIVVLRDDLEIARVDPGMETYTDGKIGPGSHTYRLEVPGVDGDEGCRTGPCDVLVGPPYRVNCGGGRFTDELGRTWWPEPGPAQGLVYTVPDLDVFGTEDDPLFRTQRSGTAEGIALSYSFFVPAGLWRVTLHLAEIFDHVEEIGERTFDVWIAGDRAAEEVDVFARVGFAAADTVCWDVRTPAAALTIALVRREGVPAVAGIEITSSPAGGASIPGLRGGLTESGAAAFAWRPSPDPPDAIRIERDGVPLAELPGDTTAWTDPTMPDGAHVYAVTTLKDGTPACPRRIALELPPLRINSGGYGFRDIRGEDWGPDRYVKGGTRRRILPPPAVQGADDPRIYAATRVGSGEDAVIHYGVPAVRGRLYLLRLHFADVDPDPDGRGGPFDVQVNGRTVLRDFDVTSAFGLQTAGIVPLQVAPAGGTIEISLQPARGMPRISAIDLDPLVGFRRGDVSGDGILAINDPIVLLGHIFAGAPAPGCLDAADTDDDGVLTIADAIALLNHLFAGGPSPAPPGPAACGVDPTIDDLGPCRFRGCPPSVSDPLPSGP